MNKINQNIEEIEVKPYIPANWYTEQGALKKMNLLQKKGLPSFNNWRFITLTVDPLKFKNSESAYLHVKKRFRYFIRALKAQFDLPSDLQWISKLEFQENGYPHWHMILNHKKLMCVNTLKELWGNGLVNIQRINQNQMPYTFKYVTKQADGLPDWFLKLNRPRILQTSNIFVPLINTKEDDSGDDKESSSDGTLENLGTRLNRYKNMITYKTKRGKFPIPVSVGMSWSNFLHGVLKNQFHRFEHAFCVFLPLSAITHLNINIV